MGIFEDIGAAIGSAVSTVVNAVEDVVEGVAGEAAGAAVGTVVGTILLGPAGGLIGAGSGAAVGAAIDDQQPSDAPAEPIETIEAIPVTVPAPRLSDGLAEKPKGLRGLDADIKQVWGRPDLKRLF